MQSDNKPGNNKNGLANKPGSLQLHRPDEYLAGTREALYDFNASTDDFIESLGGPKSKRTRKPIDRLVVGDPKHFGKKSKGSKGGRA